MSITFLKDPTYSVIMTDKSMVTILKNFNVSLEICFLATVEKTHAADTNHTNYIIDNVCFPPQFNEPSEAKTLDSQYPTWYASKMKEINKPLKLHGHTHTFDSCTPSGPDVSFYNTLKSETNTYQLRMIVSKTFAFTLDIIDVEDNWEIRDVPTIYTNSSEWHKAGQIIPCINEEVPMLKITRRSDTDEKISYMPTSSTKTFGYANGMTEEEYDEAMLEYIEHYNLNGHRDNNVSTQTSLKQSTNNKHRKGKHYKGGNKR